MGAYSFLAGLFDVLLLFCAFLFVAYFGCNVVVFSNFYVISAPRDVRGFVERYPSFRRDKIRGEMRPPCSLPPFYQACSYWSVW